AGAGLVGATDGPRCAQVEDVAQAVLLTVAEDVDLHGATAGGSAGERDGSAHAMAVFALVGIVGAGVILDVAIEVAALEVEALAELHAAAELHVEAARAEVELMAHLLRQPHGHASAGGDVLLELVAVAERLAVVVAAGTELAQEVVIAVADDV